ncbi:MAG TPA: TlpA disulfide reductase family protein [Sphingomicrobium sp.]|nr:TlpA disulfide reductase family protein [Sphingomicrobium sp.]
MRRSIALTLLAVLAAFSVASCDRRDAREASPEEVESPKKGVDRSRAGEPMPDVGILDSEDETATLLAASGQPVLVNLWASWCAPCVKELPTLEAMSRSKEAPRVIIVSVDIGPRASVDAFLEKHDVAGLQSWRDPNMALAGALGVQVMPTTIYYDGSGREIWRYVGDLDWTGAEAARLLAEAAPAGSR